MKSAKAKVTKPENQNWQLANTALCIAQQDLNDELVVFCTGDSDVDADAYRIRSMRMVKELMVFIEALEHEKRRGPTI